MVTFRNKCYEKISNTGYIVVALEDNRLYFKGYSALGFKLGRTHVNDSMFIRVNPGLSIVGEDNLKYDEENKLYYVEVQKEKKDG